MGFQVIYLILSSAYTNAHILPEDRAGEIWTALPGWAWAGMVWVPSNKKHRKALITGEATIRQPSKWGLTVPSLKWSARNMIRLSSFNIQRPFILGSGFCRVP